MNKLVLCSLLVASQCALLTRSKNQKENMSLADLTGQVNPRSRLNDQQRKCREHERARVSYEEEVAFGGAVAVAWVRRGGGLRLDRPAGSLDELMKNRARLQAPKSADNELTRYLNRVGKNLAAFSSRPTIDWTFAVLESEAVNAISAPGGYVFVTTGLLRAMPNEAALAGVLAHEIIHVTERHALKLYGQIKSEQCQTPIKIQAGLAAAGGAVGGELGALLNATIALDLNEGKNAELLRKLTDSFVDGYVSRGFSHADEYEADWRALELILAAGYHPEPYIDFLGKLPPSDGTFDHHPPSRERQLRLRRWLQRLKPAPDDLLANPDWPFGRYVRAPYSKPLIPSKS